MLVTIRRRRCARVLGDLKRTSRDLFCQTTFCNSIKKGLPHLRTALVSRGLMAVANLPRTTFALRRFDGTYCCCFRCRDYDLRSCTTGPLHCSRAGARMQNCCTKSYRSTTSQLLVLKYGNLRFHSIACQQSLEEKHTLILVVPNVLRIGALKAAVTCRISRARRLPEGCLNNANCEEQ